MWEISLVLECGFRFRLLLYLLAAPGIGMTAIPLLPL